MQENNGFEKLRDGSRILLQCSAEGRETTFDLSYPDVQKIKGLRNSVLG